MDIKDKTPPASSIEDDLSAEEKAMHEEALKRQEKLASGASSGTADEALPKVQSDQAQ